MVVLELDEAMSGDLTPAELARTKADAEHAFDTDPDTTLRLIAEVERRRAEDNNIDALLGMVPKAQPGAINDD